MTRDKLKVGNAIFEPKVPSASEVATALDVDDWLPSNSKLWDLIENNCMPECCGIQSFQFTHNGLKGIDDSFSSRQLQKSLDRATVALESVDSFVRSEKLNWICHPKDLSRVLQFISDQIRGIAV